MTRFWRMGIFLFLAAMVLSVAACQGTADPAANYPNKTVVFTTHSNPGGGGDILGRQLIEALKGQKINAVLENRAGGSGAVNMAYAASRPGDGYTLMIATFSNMTTPHLASTPQSFKDFKPVARLQTEEEAILVKADAPWKTVDDLLKDAKAGKVKFGGSFIGNIDSLIAFQLGKVANFKVDYVPFEGGGEITTALLGGHIQVAISNAAESLPQLKSGQFRMLALASEKPVSFFQGVPTLKEKGVDIVQVQWRGVWAPKETPDPIVAKAADFLKKATQEPSFKKYSDEGLLSDAFLPGQDYYKFMEGQDKEIGTLVDQLGLRGSQKK